MLARIASAHKISRRDACIQSDLYVDIGGLPATESGRHVLDVCLRQLIFMPIKIKKEKQNWAYTEIMLLLYPWFYENRPKR